MLNQAVWALYHHFAALFYFIFKLLFFPSVYNFSKILLIIYQSKVGSLRNVSHPIIHRGSRYFCCIVLLSIYFQLGCIVLLYTHSICFQPFSQRLSWVWVLKYKLMTDWFGAGQVVEHFNTSTAECGGGPLTGQRCSAD
jgi:hypothetical protein